MQAVVVRELTHTLLNSVRCDVVMLRCNYDVIPYTHPDRQRRSTTLCRFRDDRAHQSVPISSSTGEWPPLSPTGDADRPRPLGASCTFIEQALKPALCEYQIDRMRHSTRARRRLQGQANRILPCKLAPDRCRASSARCKRIFPPCVAGRGQSVRFVANLFADIGAAAAIFTFTGDKDGREGGRTAFLPLISAAPSAALAIRRTSNLDSSRPLTPNGPVELSRNIRSARAGTPPKMRASAGDRQCPAGST